MITALGILLLFDDMEERAYGSYTFVLHSRIHFPIFPSTHFHGLITTTWQL